MSWRIRDALKYNGRMLCAFREVLIFLCVGSPVFFVDCQPKRGDDVAASDESKTRAASPSTPGADAKKGEDSWQRMKDCAEQTDRVAKQFGWAGASGIMGWRNHYSSKYGRCYILVTYKNHEANKNPDLPPIYDELFDAFEHRTLSICTDATTPRANLFCSIQADPSTQFDCGTCRKFTKDRMDD